MSDEVELQALRDKVEEQGKVLLQLKEDAAKDAADAEERQKLSHEQLVGMMSELLARRGGTAEDQEESGGQATVVAAGGGHAAHLSPRGDSVGEVPGGGEAAGNSHLGGPDEEGSTGGYAPLGEGRQSSHSLQATGGYAPLGEGQQSSHSLLARAGMKMAVPTFNGENFDMFAKNAMMYAKLLKFDLVFTTDPYVNVGAEDISKESFTAEGGSPVMYERQLMALAFLSQAFKCPVDINRFHRGTSPRQVWEDTVEWYDTTSNAQKSGCLQKLHNFKIRMKDNPVEKFLEMEDLHVKLMNAGVGTDIATTYACFLNALPQDEYAQEIRDIGLMSTYSRKDILHLVRSRYDALQKDKKSTDGVALVSDGRGSRSRKKGSGGRGGGKKQQGGSNKDSGKESDRKKEECWRCHMTNHYADKCTTLLCEKCHGRNHSSSQCPSKDDNLEDAKHALMVRLVDDGYSVVVDSL